MRPLLRSAPGAAPWFIGVQRRYRSQNAPPTVDARIEFDLRTIAREGSGSSRVKPQPVLLRTAFDALHNRGPNYQMALGLLIPYRGCQVLRTPRVLDLIARAWTSSTRRTSAIAHSDASRNVRSGRDGAFRRTGCATPSRVFTWRGDRITSGSRPWAAGRARSSCWTCTAIFCRPKAAATPMP